MPMPLSLVDLFERRSVCSARSGYFSGPIRLSPTERLVLAEILCECSGSDERADAL